MKNPLDFTGRVQSRPFLFVGAVITCAVLIFSSVVLYRMGNFFFGEVSGFYNVEIAQFFFKKSAYPIIGNATPFAHHQLSRTYFIQGKLDEALSEAYKELALYPNNIQTYYILGLTLGFMDREEEAIEAFGKYLEKYPRVWGARNDMAWLQFRIGDIEGALRTIEPATVDTNNAWVQNTYGVLLMNAERYREAKEAFVHAERAASWLTPSSWGSAYPGNDPRVYEMGLSAMQESIEKNLKTLEIVGI